MIFAAANATGSTLLSLDDPSVSTDQGAAFSAKFRTTGFDLGPATGFGTLRRYVQSVAVSAQATMVVTPMGDGMEYTGQRSSHTINPASGAQQQIEVPTAVPGTRFQLDVEITAHDGAVEFGESDQWIVARRSQRGGSA